MQSTMLKTGIDGLDVLLGGGLPRGHVYLVQGDPGNGKTTFALQFLLEGAKEGETVLYVNLSESEAELRAVATSHGWSLEGIHLFEMRLGADTTESEDYTLLHPSEAELTHTVKTILAEVDRVKPSRVVIDSLSEIRLLAEHRLRYRRQVLMLKQHFAGEECTVILLDDLNAPSDDYQLQTVAHGVLTLEKHVPLYGPAKRRLSLVKLRGVDFADGYHDYKIVTGGIVVFPNVDAARMKEATPSLEPVSSGLPALDALLGGGLDRGTSTLLIGPAGVGKSAVASQYMAAAARRGEKSALFAFDESLPTMFHRARSLGCDLRGFADRGLIAAHAIDPTELTPGELAHVVRRSVERDGARVVVIDSLNGYLNAMPEEQFLVAQMHELLSFLGRHGVITILISAQHGLLGPAMAAPVDVSYLADTVLLLRYFEAGGNVHKAISVLKKRSGAHETTIREFVMRHSGLSVGPPLDQFHGVLTGVPTYVGAREPLIKTAAAHDGSS